MESFILVRQFTKVFARAGAIWKSVCPHLFGAGRGEFEAFDVQVCEEKSDPRIVRLIESPPLRIGSNGCDPTAQIRAWEARFQQKYEIRRGGDFSNVTRSIFSLLVEATWNRLMEQIPIVGLGERQVIFGRVKSIRLISGRVSRID